MEDDRISSDNVSNFTPRGRTRKIAILRGLAILLLLFALPAIWSWTPLNHWINLATIIGWQESVRNQPAAFYLVVGAYLLGSLVLFPVTIFNVATVLTLLTLRIFPVAPFTLVNVFVGAWGIRFWDFFTASIVGRIPGIILLTLAGIQIENFLRQPHVIGVVLLGLTLILVPFA